MAVSGNSFAQNYNIIQNTIVKQSKLFDQSKTLEQSKMATIEVSEKVLRSIHTYDGNLFLLPLFTDMLRELKRVYCSTSENFALNNWIICQNVIKNIVGEAKLVIAKHPISCLDDIIRILENNFTDKRSVAVLEDELSHMRQGRDDPIEFLNKIIEKQTQIIAKYKVEEYYRDDHMTHTRALEMRALNTLRKGLNPPLNALLATMQPQSLDHARSMIQNDLQIVLEQTPAPFRPFKNNYGKAKEDKFHYNKAHNYLAFNPQNYQAPPQQYHFQPQSYFPQQSHYPQNYHPQNQFHENAYHQNHFYKPNFNRNINHQLNPNQNNRNNPTVSMRTVSKFNKRQNIQNFKSPYEITHVENERLGNLEQKIEKLAETFNNFLELNSNPDEGPPNQENLN